MKKLLFIIALISLVSFAKAQQYIPFPDSNAIWREHYTDNQGTNNHYQLGIIGDTIINSLLYHKIYYEPNCLSDTILTKHNSILIGGIREDSLRRIFFYNIDFSDFVIWTSVQVDSIYKLYDFSVHVGDTVKFQAPSAPPVYAFHYLVLDSIDSVFTYNHYRKLYHLSGESWIEGIGSPRSLFSAIIRIPTCYCSWENVCYEFNNITYYLNPPYLDCYDMTENNKEYLNNNTGNITVYPNPTNDKLTIEFLQKSTMEILNIQGQTILQQQLQQGKTAIDISGIAKGVYILRLCSNDKTVVTKIVKE